MKKFRLLVPSVIMSIMLAFTASCGHRSVEPSVNALPEALYSLKTTNISTVDDFDEILSLDSYGDNIFVFGRLSDESYGGYVSDSELIGYEGFSFQSGDEEAIVAAAQLDDGKKLILGYKDNTTYIHIFSADGNEDSLIGCEEILYSDMNYARIVADDNGYYINVNNEYISVTDKSGNYIGNVELNGKDLCGLTRSSDDIPTALLTDINGKMTIASLAGTTIADEKTCSEMSSPVIAVCAGTGEYSIAAVFYDAMYGLNGDKWVRLCDLTENDFAPYEVTNFLMLSENDLIVNINGENGAILKRMTQRDDSEVQQAQTVKIAAVINDDELSYYVRQYNSANDKYKIELVNYNQSQDVEENINALKMDIISGNAPDIIPFNASMPIDTLGSGQGIFVDLYSMIDADPDIGREDFVDGFLEGMASDGKLLMITPSFTIKTIECKEKFLGGLTSWNFNQMTDAYEKVSGNIEISAEAKYGSPTSAFCELINYNSFIDYEKAVCDFDNENFISLLEFFSDNGIGTTDNSGWDSDMIKNHFKNDVIMLNVTEAENFLSLYAIEGEYFNEPAVIIGYPTEEGSISYVEIETGFSILANSDVKDGAWDFLKYSFLDDRYYTGTEGSYKFPAIDKYIDQQCHAVNQLLIDAQNNGEDVEPMSDDKMSEYEAWVRESAKNIVKKDQNVENILREELDAYFNNERSAESAADMIQNRVSIYLSEKYQ